MRFRSCLIATLVMCFAASLIAGTATLPGCAATQPATAAGTTTTQPATTQPAQPSAGQVVNGALDTVTTYGPVVQAILAAIPNGVPAAMWLGVALVVINSLKKNFGNNPTTPDQWAADVEAFAQDLLPALSGMLPGKSAAEVQAVVNVAKAVLQQQQQQPPAK